MRAVIQRVLESSVSVDGRVVGESGKGYMILVGVVKGDTETEAELLARKTASLRVFEDEKGKQVDIRILMSGDNPDGNGIRKCIRLLADKEQK